jgi:uncharacterized protein (TIGR04255 family)
LEEVICQLRFPTILRIESEVPAAYQERIRRQYPLFRESQGLEQQLAIAREVIQKFGQNLSLPTSVRAFEFLTADEVWTVTLTREFLALTTRNYQRWEEFREYLKEPLNSLLEEYSPPFFTRVGLRYKDVIRRSALGLQDIPWSDLLAPYVTGELSVPEVATSADEAVRRLLIRLPEGTGQVRIIHGLGQMTGSDESCYIIDSDFFVDDRTEASSALDTLDRFNKQAGRLFRWCITERLHAAMGPKSI